jgi:hypothetical protein
MHTHPRPFHAPRTLAVGRLMMGVSILGMAGSAAVAYPLADRFGLAVQIAGHIALPISAAFFKLGYVVRLAAHHALGNFKAG